MPGLKQQTLRLRPGFASIETLARHGDYSAQVKHNLVQARAIAFQTSPYRVMPRHSFKNALLATRRLVASMHHMRQNASEQWQCVAVEKLELLLEQSRRHAMYKSPDVSIAQDVFVLLSQFLGLCAVPEKDCRVRLRSKLVEKSTKAVTRFSEATAAKLRRRQSAPPNMSAHISADLSYMTKGARYHQKPRATMTMSMPFVSTRYQYDAEGGSIL